MAVSTKNSSVLFCLLGLMLLMTGFNGFMAHTFSKSEEELCGLKLVKYQNLEKELENNDKVCIVSPIHSDDYFAMPDNGQNVIKGRLQIYAIWPDSTQSILLDWNKESKYIRLAGDGNSETTITPKSMECISDTSLTASHLKVHYSLNSVEIEYFNYKFTLGGCYTKGRPMIMLQREYLENDCNVALTVTRQENRMKNGSTIDVLNVVPYELAQQREKILSKSKTFYIIIAIIGIAMFFVPERDALNTLSSTKMIVNRIKESVKNGKQGPLP